MSYKKLFIIIPLASFLLCSVAYATTIGDILNRPVPNIGDFAPRAIAWFEWLWERIVYYVNIILNMDVNNPYFGFILKIVKWFWGFTVTTIHQGIDSAIVLLKMLLGSMGIDWSKLQTPWE